MEPVTQIKCPNCGNPIDVNDILYHQLEEELKRKFQLQQTEERKKFESQSEQLRLAGEKLKEEKGKIEEQISEGIRVRLRMEREILEKQIKQQIGEEEAGKFKVLQEELNEKSARLKEFNQAMAEIEKLKREKDELRESILADAQKALNEKLQEEKEKIRKSEQDKNEFILRELQKKLDDQKKLTEEMQRKQEQGSMQLQGEVQELAIEEWLASRFPLDTISEVKKGALGGDCIQTINTHTRPNCGKIYYESKRAKNFAGDWIEKFKADMRAKNITVGILVTQAYPKDMDRMGLVDGVWICSYEEFKGLSAVIRESVIRISEVAASQENKGDKMVMLYDYLISPEFKSQIEAIVEGFTTMKSDLEAEKRAMMKIWSTREKQIEKVVTNTTAMYGSIKGIGGKAIATVPSLELGSGDTEDGPE